MALPHQHLTPQEVSFICESELITIVPRQRLGALNLISIDTRPLVPPQRADVPLWLAVFLRKQKRCNIVPPDWLNVDYLERLVKEESDSAAFSQMPWRWMEVAEILLDTCSEDLISPSDIALHIRSLRELRQAKIRAGLSDQMNSSYIKINNLGLMEVCEIRPWVGKVVDGLRKIEGEAGSTAARRRRDDIDADGDEDMDDDGY
ncbi:DNA replication protein psf2 [Orbilia oligospora]|uniref:DNA replication complex GINS protein PSF2 n=1 Tax=Orbilia oligospora TaxID=2813651 RepID=A0A6G1M7C9_ORBOL|nr:DNA replication protein psf2 [Orbilia oligospora]KAF3216204.1 DNA replication protein psf2 [Orbilia oligospora]KAF3223917.1 DNA replication protein psf2 [Orbilia oligospora]KAF3229257.1 DNA replication protein psf2 [Orbilia oligospora]KAF3248762.1 DNA replication protein psf2 [Orbilia oligospora]